MCFGLRKIDSHQINGSKEYMSSKEKNLSKLIEYAVKLGVRDEVMMYVEVIV